MRAFAGSVVYSLVRLGLISFSGVGRWSGRIKTSNVLFRHRPIHRGRIKPGIASFDLLRVSVFGFSGA